MNNLKLMAAASRELKTPLTAIIANADVISNYVENIDDAKILAKNIYNDAERLAVTIKNLFSLIRLDNADYRAKIQFQTMNLTRIIREAIALCRVRITANQQELIYDSTNDCLIQSVPKLLRQVLVNLVDNAAKYSPRGSKIVVDVFCDKEFAYVSIADNGAGILECDFKRIFDSFYRADKVRALAIAGDGLGLTITKKIVDVLNGEISLQSVVDEGTTFTVKLPLNHLTTT
ncbi:MAG: HAMP domain-containing sensor histidine kinase [Bacillota bacterium]